MARRAVPDMGLLAGVRFLRAARAGRKIGDGRLEAVFTAAVADPFRSAGTSAHGAQYGEFYPITIHSSGGTSMSGRNPLSIRKAAVAGVLAAAMLLTGMTLHHGWANYHQDVALTYRGVITANDIGNPHTYIDLRVHEREWTEPRGANYDAVEEWNVVLAPLTRMRNRGMTDNSMLDVGDTVTVVGYPHRTVEREMRAERIIIGDVRIELR